MKDIPTGRPVLLRMEAAPIGWAHDKDGTITLGQASEMGVWTSEGP